MILLDNNNRGSRTLKGGGTRPIFSLNYESNENWLEKRRGKEEELHPLLPDCYVIPDGEMRRRRKRGMLFR